MSNPLTTNGFIQDPAAMLEMRRKSKFSEETLQNGTDLIFAELEATPLSVCRVLLSGSLLQADLVQLTKLASYLTVVARKDRYFLVYLLEWISRYGRTLSEMWILQLSLIVMAYAAQPDTSKKSLRSKDIARRIFYRHVKSFSEVKALYQIAYSGIFESKRGLGSIFKDLFNTWFEGASQEQLIFSRYGKLSSPRPLIQIDEMLLREQKRDSNIFTIVDDSRFLYEVRNSSARKRMDWARSTHPYALPQEPLMDHFFSLWQSHDSRNRGAVVSLLHDPHRGLPYGLSRLCIRDPDVYGAGSSEVWSALLSRATTLNEILDDISFLIDKKVFLRPRSRAHVLDLLSQAENIPPIAFGISVHRLRRAFVLIRDAYEHASDPELLELVNSFCRAYFAWRTQLKVFATGAYPKQGEYLKYTAAEGYVFDSQLSSHIEKMVCDTDLHKHSLRRIVEGM